MSSGRKIHGGKTGRRRALFICYLFPPVGGAGVQRSVKFIKYLRHFGWDVTVLTVENPSVPVFDDSLLEDIPEGTRLHKARTLEPDYRYKMRLAKAEGVAQTVPAGSGKLSRKSLAGRVKGVLRNLMGRLLQPDPQILWFPAAARKALKLLRDNPHDIIFATAPPYSSMLLGSWLKRKTGLPLVLDFRDEWDLSSTYLENRERDLFSHFVQQRMQRRILHSADGVVATTEASTRRITERADEYGAKISGICVYNGFDETDFAPVSCAGGTKRPGERLRLVYTGTLWNLTTVEPLVAAVKRLSGCQDLMERLELVFVGRKMSHQLALLEQLRDRGCRLDIRDYCEHKEVVSIMNSADVLCLLLSSVEGAERVVPAKLFEYLAAGREILAITPEGEAADIVTRHFPRNHFVGSDIDGISSWLRNRIEGLGESPYPPVRNRDISMFSRKSQAGRLADYFDQVVAG